MTTVNGWTQAVQILAATQESLAWTLEQIDSVKWPNNRAWAGEYVKARSRLKLAGDYLAAMRQAGVLP